MACFLVGTTEAIVVSAVAQIVKKQEEKQTHAEQHIAAQSNSIPWSRKLTWLSYLLFGGAVLLCFEHVWHGEVVPFFPFLTAMNDPGDTAEMLHEMATVGTTMACIVTVVWAAVCAAADSIVKRSETGKAV